MAHGHEVKRQIVRVGARDGFTLQGTLFEPSGTSRAALLLAPGTGIPRGYYKGFAAALCGQGVTVLTLDYRGVAGSRPPRLSGFQASKVDWARLDLSAGFDFLKRVSPQGPRLVLGHSVGGQLLALMDQHTEVDAIFTYGTGFGYWGAVAGAYRYFVAGMWYVGVPLLTQVFGYLPAKRLGLGEDLPAGVARDWARWGRRRNYFTSELAHEPGFKAIRAPWRAVYALDDEIATADNVRAMLGLYPNAAIDIQYVDPVAWGYEGMGHVPFFSRAKLRAWRFVFDWLDTVC